MIADLLLGIGAFGAGTYCFILGRRLKKFRNMEEGIGAAVSILSTQVSEMTQALERSKAEAGKTSLTLVETTERAEKSARRLELLIASLHDIPSENETTRTITDTQKTTQKPRTATFLRRGSRDKMTEGMAS